jgi:hypothetical protein
LLEVPTVAKFVSGNHPHRIRDDSSGANPVGPGCHKVAKKNAFAFTFLSAGAFYFSF